MRATLEKARRALLTDPVTGEALDLLGGLMLVAGIILSGAMVLAAIGLALALGPNP